MWNCPPLHLHCDLYTLFIFLDFVLCFCNLLNSLGTNNLNKIVLVRQKSEKGKHVYFCFLSPLKNCSWFTKRTWKLACDHNVWTNVYVFEPSSIWNESKLILSCYFPCLLKLPFLPMAQPKICKEKLNIILKTTFIASLTSNLRWLY